jgi:ionotropic glutamate receptor
MLLVKSTIKKNNIHFSPSVCHLLKSGVAALFGPESGTTSSHVQSICDAMEIPHIETRWDFLTKRDDYSINLYPSPKQISKVTTKHLPLPYGEIPR